MFDDRVVGHVLASRRQIQTVYEDLGAVAL